MTATITDEARPMINDNRVTSEQYRTMRRRRSRKLVIASHTIRCGARQLTRQSVLAIRREMERG